jgi:alpha-L-arabinofuranosidase
MKVNLSPELILAAVLGVGTFSGILPSQAADTAGVSVQVDQPGLHVPSTLHGIFFEDINYAADGGLYAELVQNRSFEHRDPLYSWRESGRGAKGALSVESDGPLNANNWNFLRIHVTEPGTNGFGAVNSGFDGIAVRKGERYLFSIYARRRAGEDEGLRVVLVDRENHPLGSTEIKSLGRSWKKFEATLTATGDTANARLAVLATRPGAVDVDMVSLFPEKTFKGRRNGLRVDLAQALADMKPGFLRFPGGCIVEGKDFENMYRWKDTIGDVAERKQNWNVWQDNTSPQYHQTYGLGFFEYFQLCEDIGAEPVPVVNCGMCCQARNGPVVPLNKLSPYIQDALDLIEFANGAVSTEWGARRAALGHPKPFHLKFLAVGNEQWEQGYFDRYNLFLAALKAKYPEIQLISSSGPHPDDPLWHFAWGKFRSGTPADVVDEHYYVPPRWLLEHGDRYDSYDRKGPKIFVGEFAGHDRGRHNNLRSALAEAAYMTSLWRNADVVLMASYAPLFAKAGHAQWRPDLIWFDNTRVALTPNYYAQAQFAANRPDVTLATQVDAPMDKPPRCEGMIGVGTWKTQAEYKDIRVVADDGRMLFESDFSKGLDGWKTVGGDWSVADGALRQTGTNENIRAVAGDPSWANYTLTLRARKLGGSEGFLILYETPDADSPAWWNLGGWRNTEHALQNGTVPERHVRGSIETNRWYDIRIESRHDSVKAYLDNELVHQEVRKPVAKFYAVAGRDLRAKEIVVQMVNPSADKLDVSVKLKGLRNAGNKAKVITLSNPNLDAENTLDHPDRVVPHTSDFNGVAPEFVYPLEPSSLVTIRIPEK